MSLKTWEILRPGNYPEGQITEDMVRDIVSTFGQRGDVPIGIGHQNYWWRDDLPAEGYIRKNQEFGISKKGALVSKGVDLLPGLKEAYEEGRYAKWSAVIGRKPIYDDENKRTGKYTKWELFAVDVLGRTAPAIKGLRDLTGKKAGSEELKKYNVSFSEENENVMFFGNQEVEILQFSGDFSNTGLDNDNNRENDDMKIEELQKQIEGLTAKFSNIEAEKTEMSNKIKDLENEKSEKEKELAAYKAKAEEAEKVYKSGQIEILEKATKMLPKEMKERLFSAIENTAGNNISFTEGEKKTSIFSVFSECLEHVINVSSDNPGSEMDPAYSEHEYGDVETKAFNEGKKLLESSSDMVEAID